MNKDIKEIREYIACPQLGDDHYGKWGALRLDQRIKIKQLLDYITNLQEENEKLSVELNTCMIERNQFLSENERLNNIINELEKDIIREENKNNEALKNKYKMGNYLSERTEETIGIENDIYDYVLTRLQELKEGK